MATRRNITLKESELEALIQRAFEDDMETMGQFSSCYNLLEMARVGRTNEGYEVYIRGRDNGNIPHVHVFNTQKKSVGKLEHFETCIQLNTNAYFLHGPYVDKLNSIERKDFMSFMSSKPIIDDFNTNYEWAVALWNANNFGNAYVKAQPKYDTQNGEKRVIIPNYRNMA